MEIQVKAAIAQPAIKIMEWCRIRMSVTTLPFNFLSVRPILTPEYESRRSPILAGEHATPGPGLGSDLGLYTADKTNSRAGSRFLANWLVF